MKYEYEARDDLAFCPDCKLYYDIESNNEYGFFCCEECAEIKIAEIAEKEEAEKPEKDVMRENSCR